MKNTIFRNIKTTILSNIAIFKNSTFSKELCFPVKDFIFQAHDQCQKVYWETPILPSKIHILEMQVVMYQPIVQQLPRLIHIYQGFS